MELITALIVGLATGVFITWFPGMLNMQAVATSVRAGRSKAYQFSTGMAVTIGGQTAVAVMFADLISSHPDFMSGLKRWAVPILAALALGFAVKGFRARAARKAHKERPYTGTPFWRGFMLSFMNVLNIPFIFAIAGFLMAGGWLSRAYYPRLLFVPGTALGALLIFLLYARLGKWIERHAAYFTRNINFFLAGLLALLMVVQFWRVV